MIRSTETKAIAHSDYASLACVRDRSGRRCLGSLMAQDRALVCNSCGTQYDRVAGIPILFESPSLNHNEGAAQFYATYKGSQHADLSSFRQHAASIGYQQSQLRAVNSLVTSLQLPGPSLEVGCAGGLFVDLVPEYIGLEFSLNALLVPGFEAIRTVNADAARLPFPSAYFTFVFSVNTLEHVPRIDDAVAEIDRVLKPNGVLFLSPAWNCTRYNNELVPILPYRQLNVRQKAVKALLPILRSRIFKALVRIPRRAARMATSRSPIPLRWTALQPNFGSEVLADQDACTSIDPYDLIQFFCSRGYKCLSHPSRVSQLVAGGEPVVLRKHSADL
jgi:SAM-dependent methyltransferase